MLIETQIYFIVFLILLTLIYVSTFYEKASQLERFVTRMPIASQLFLAMGIYITYMLFRTNYNATAINQSTQTTKDIIYKTLDTLDKYKETCPNLINSFFYPWQKDEDEKLINSFNKDSELDSLIVSNCIFQGVGILLQSNTIDIVSNPKFLRFFSSFFKSELLKNEWDKFKINFGLPDRLLCDKLFEINSKIHFQNAEEMIVYFDNFAKSDEYKKIVNAKQITNASLI